MSVLKSRRTESDAAFFDVARRLEAYTSEGGYRSGDRAVHGGERWVSEVNENAWTPGAYGWNKRQEE